MLLILSVISLRWINPPFTAFTLQENWDVLDEERYDLREWWVPGEEIPHHLKWSVIGAEDQHFYNHWGLDVASIREARREMQEGVRVRGASTISQQVAKNLYLWPAQSMFRKAVEAGITILIELTWPKDRILEMYLNIAEFGPGIYGTGKAAHHFFDLPASALEPDMTARMAAALPNPKRMRVEPASPFVEQRSEWILRQIFHLTGVQYLPEVPDEEVFGDLDPLPPGFWQFEDWDVESYHTEFDTTAFWRDYFQTKLPQIPLPDTIPEITPIQVDTVETDGNF